MRALRRPRPIRFFLTSIVVFFTLQSGLCAQEQQAAWLLQPALSAGVVFEFSQYAHVYTGRELIVRFAPSAWVAQGGLRVEDYTMSYFGITTQAAGQVIKGQPVTGPVLPHVEVAERKTTQELMIGRKLWGDRFVFLAGVRVHSLNNDFSSMKATGPAVRADGGIDSFIGRISWRIDGAAYQRQEIANHRLNEYVLPDGERTISFYGEPKYAAGWGAAVGPRDSAWRHLSIGYEGAVMVLKYGYRHYQGIVLRGSF